MRTREEGEWKTASSSAEMYLWHSGGGWGGGISQKISADSQERSAEVCYTWLEVEPSQLIYLEPVGPCGLWGSAHILRKTNEAPEHMKWRAWQRFNTNMVSHEIVWLCFLGIIKLGM